MNFLRFSVVLGVILMSLLFHIRGCSCNKFLRTIKFEKSTSQKCLTIRQAWRIWASIGTEDGRNNRGGNDAIACIRTLIFVSYMVTNIAIVNNAVRHWDSNQSVPVVSHTLT